MKPIKSVMTNLACLLDTLGKREPQLKDCLHQTDLVDIGLSANGCRRAHPTVGSTIHFGQRA